MSVSAADSTPASASVMSFLTDGSVFKTLTNSAIESLVSMVLEVEPELLLRRRLAQPVVTASKSLNMVD